MNRVRRWLTDSGAESPDAHEGLQRAKAQKKGYHQSTNSKRRLTRSRQMRRGQFARLLLGAVASCLLRAAEGVSYHNTSYSFGRCYDNER